MGTITGTSNSYLFQLPVELGDDGPAPASLEISLATTCLSIRSRHPTRYR